MALPPASARARGSRRHRCATPADATPSVRSSASAVWPTLTRSTPQLRSTADRGAAARERPPACSLLVLVGGQAAAQLHRPPLRWERDVDARGDLRVIAVDRDRIEADEGDGVV